MPDPTAMTESTDQRPTTQGWYWVRQEYPDSPWMVVQVIKIRDYLCTRDPYLDVIHQIKITDTFWSGSEWIGPITPDDVAELARLRAAAGGH